jgi:hypothetical protein
MMSTPEVKKRRNEKGEVEYCFTSVSDWNGFDSFVHYLQKYWDAEVIESADWIYSRRWVLRSNGVSISVYHDSQIGNYFLREDGSDDQSLLAKIENDVIMRFGGAAASSTVHNSTAD